MKEINLEFILRVLDTFANIEYTDAIWWRTDGEYAPVSFFVNCNDVFWWATADAEDLTPENIDLLEQTIRDIKALIDPNEKLDPVMLIDAPTLFVARVRQMRPQGAYYKYLNPKLWSLYDACGPEREVKNEPFGNTPKPSDIKLINQQEENNSIWNNIKKFLTRK